MAEKVAAMKTTTVNALKDQAGKMLHSDEPLVITHKGKAAGVYISLESQALPRELRNQLLEQLVEATAQEMAEKGITEEQVLAEFEAARKARR